MTKEQRRHFDNGIWLCTLHAREVDTDFTRYSPDELRRWKAEAEVAAHAGQGKPVPSNQDAIDQAIALLGRAPEHFLPDAIKNTHTAVAATLQAMDPDVDVDTGFVGGKACYYLSPRRPLNITFTGEGPAGARLDDALNSVMRDGADVTIPMDGISICGSKAFELLMRDAESLTVGAIPSEAVIRLSCPGKDHLVVEFRGEARAGRQATTVAAEGLGGLLRTELIWPYDASGPAPRWTLRFDFATWENLSVTDLPHFERAHRLVEAQAASAAMTLELEIEGRRMFETKSTGPLDPGAFSLVAGMIACIADARTISQFTGSTILARLGLTTRSDAKNLSDLADTIRTVGQPRQLREDDALTIPVQPEVEILDALSKPGPHIFRVSAPQHSVKVFQQPVTIPALTTILSHVDLQLNRRDMRKAKRGEPVMLEVTPTGTSMMSSWLT